MRVLVTGSAGYIGSSLVPKLIQAGHTVKGVDIGYYSNSYIEDLPGGFDHITQDIRLLDRSDFENVDAVVHLAALSNDPLGDVDPLCTFSINHAAAIRVARLAKAAGARRFIFSSSCSVYGKGDSTPRSEESPVTPLTAYAASKVAAEHDITNLADSDFTTVVLRNATAYGYAPMLRLDLMLNYQAGLGYACSRVQLLDDGSAWRPFVHVDDISNVITFMLTAPERTINGERFNVGSSSDCLPIREVAEIITATIPGCKLVKKAEAGRDHRSYRIDDSKFRRAFPQFHFSWNIAAGIADLVRHYSRIGLTETHLQSEKFKRLPVLLDLLRLGRVNPNLFWTENGCSMLETI